MRKKKKNRNNHIWSYVSSSSFWTHRCYHYLRTPMMVGYFAEMESYITLFQIMKPNSQQNILTELSLYDLYFCVQPRQSPGIWIKDVNLAMLATITYYLLKQEYMDRSCRPYPFWTQLHLSLLVSSGTWNSWGRKKGMQYDNWPPTCMEQKIMGILQSWKGK